MAHTEAPWLIAGGTTVYALKHYGWNRGVEQFQNSFSALVQGDDAKDNALLIAAAPELLHACRLVTENAPLIAEYIKATDPGAFAQIQAAIKKATQP